MLEVALKHIMSFVLENDEVKKFPKDFVTASMQWIRSWFLIDDPVAEAVINSPGNEALKETVVKQKLPQLIENEQFVKELQTQIEASAVHRERMKNIVDNSSVDVQGNIHIGDRGTASGENYDLKNVVRGSTIKAGGDFRLGDDVVQAGGNVHIGDIHYHGGTQKEPSAKVHTSDFIRDMRNLIAANRVDEAIPQIIDYTETNAPHLQNDVLLLSGSWGTLKRKERLTVLSNSEANVERNKIVSALLEIIRKLG